MTRSEPTAAPAALMLVFGASGHIGGPLARHVRAASPGMALRLATSSPEKVATLERDFPEAEVVTTSYLDEPALAAALAGVDRVFMVTPDFLDEDRAMATFVTAARAAGTIRHVVRIVGLPPGATLDSFGAALADPGPAVGHLRSVAMLRDGGVPLTVLNSAGYFMDDLALHFALPLKRSRTLVVPYERRMCFTETAELGEVAARLLLSDTDGHVGRTYDFNSGEDPIAFRDVAALMSEVLGVDISYDPSPGRFVDELGPILTRFTGDDRATHRLLTDFRAELEYESAFAGSPFGEEILGRAPTTLREWLVKNRDALLA